MVDVIWTEFAIENLHSIHEYISRDSKLHADRYIDKLIQRVEQLESFPKSGRVVPEFNLDIIRELIEGNYRIIYKLATNQISIVTIHHSARILK
jgi:addiction module RelE/StbE family toxin